MFLRKTRRLSDAVIHSLRFARISLVLLFLASLPKLQPQTVAITVDDLPYASPGGKPATPEQAKTAELINNNLLHVFSDQHIPVTGFAVEQYAEEIGIDKGREILKQWTRPGFDLGNHTYSHANSDTLSVDRFEQQIIRGESTISPLLQSVSRRPQYFRFPYNHTGDTKEKHDAIAAFLAARGYRLAPCTIDNSDYVFDQTYVLAIKRGDKEAAARLRADYLSYTAAEIDWYSKLDRQVFGYDVPHVMLLHDNQLNADTIADVLALFKKRAYRFVSLTSALQDPAYATPETYITKFGPMWGYRWAKELNVKVDGSGEPDPPVWVNQYMKENGAGAD